MEGRVWALSSLCNLGRLAVPESRGVRSERCGAAVDNERVSTEERAGDEQPPAESVEPPQDRAQHRSSALPPRRWRLLAVIAAVGLVADFVTKSIAVALVGPAEIVPVLGGAVYFQLLRNPSAAFGLGAGMTPLLTVFAILVVAGIGYFALRIRSKGWAVGFGLVLAGALGNLVDRLFRPPGPFQGHVVDFVSVFAPNGEIWPVFNVADSCITVGAVLVVVLSLFGKDYDGDSPRRRNAQRQDRESGPEAAGG